MEPGAGFECQTRQVFVLGMKEGVADSRFEPIFKRFFNISSHRDHHLCDGRVLLTDRPSLPAEGRLGGNGWFFRGLILRNPIKMRPESQASAVGLKACSTYHPAPRTSEQAPGDRSPETLQAPVQLGFFDNTRYELRSMRLLMLP